MDQWFYEKSGARIGPKTEEELRELLEQGEVSYETLVWHSQMGKQWKKVKDTELQLEKCPPLPASHVNNSVAWAIILVPVLGSIIEIILGDHIDDFDPYSFDVLIFYFVTYCVLASVDSHIIKTSGHRNIALWVILIPVYLYKRAKALGQGLFHFWMWWLLVLSSIYIVPMIMTTAYWGTGIPSCSSSYTKAAIHTIYSEQFLNQLFRMEVARIIDVAEVKSGEKTRYCKAKIFNSNDKYETLSYRIIDTPDKFVVKLD
jgi:hypothetical protein